MHLPTNPEASTDAHRLYETLRLVPIGETIAYHTLSTLVGRDVQRTGRHVLAKARRMAHQQDAVVFAAVTNVGLQHLTDVRKCTLGADVRGLRRALRRKVRLLAAVRDFAALPPDAQLKHQAGLSLWGTVGLMLKPSEVRRIEAAVVGAQRELRMDETLRLFAPTSG